jgi:hypothetical protein
MSGGITSLLYPTRTKPLELSPSYQDLVKDINPASHRGRTEALNTKIGLSFGTLIGLSSLRDELPEFRRRLVGMIGSL